MLRNIAVMRAWAARQNAENVAARSHVEGSGPLPQRLAALALTGRFLTDFADMVAVWSTWARATVASWPDDGSAPAPDLEALAAIAARPLEPGDLPDRPEARDGGRGNGLGQDGALE